MPIYQLGKELIFPRPELAEDDGLLAVGGDLSPERLLLAYSLGIFPWFAEGDPILWWSPAPRLIIEPGRLHVPSRLRRTLRQGVFQITMDTAFARVIAACASIPRAGDRSTWITPAMITAYCRLHELGFAHSVECWQDEKLAGGLYGLALGGVFFGESMFSRISDSSKVALTWLVKQLHKWDFAFIDCQVANMHLRRLGAVEISRQEFEKRLAAGLKKETKRGKWRFDANLQEKAKNKNSPLADLC
jgi:leucyl/phenylalanyl-tRNA--protein transferase